MIFVFIFSNVQFLLLSAHSIICGKIQMLALKSEFSLMNEQLNAYSKEIYELSQREFAILDFAELVTKIRNHVSEVANKTVMILRFSTPVM